MTFFLERKQDLSVYYLIKDLFETDTFITVVDDFPVTELDIPTISIENSAYFVEWYELGNRKGVDTRTWFINIFAENKSQRDDYAYLIKNEVQNGIPVYDYEEGFPPDVSPTQLGSMGILELRVEPIRVDPDSVSTLYWRTQITVVARYNKPLE
jgi:hypothetical protein